jgi:hypothetical protein
MDVHQAEQKECTPGIAHIRAAMRAGLGLHLEKAAVFDTDKARTKHGIQGNHSGVADADGLELTWLVHGVVRPCLQGYFFRQNLSVEGTGPAVFHILQDQGPKTIE